MKFTVVLLALFIVSKADAHTSHPKKIKCPIDGKRFTIRVTGSYTTNGTTLDFQKQGFIGDFYESMVNSCPVCHYCGYERDFDTTYSKKTKEGIRMILAPYKSAVMNDVLEHEITIRIYQHFGRSNDDIANLYLLASYFLRDDSLQVVKRKELQSDCALLLKKAIEAGEYNTAETRSVVHYLIGEMYRRSDDFIQAREYYDRAINDENKPDWLADIAKKQKELAISEDDNNSI